MARTQRKPITWSPAAIRSLGARTGIKEACSVLGISNSLGYQLVREDNFPVRVIHLGNRIVVPVRGLLELFDIDDSADGFSAAA